MKFCIGITAVIFAGLCFLGPFLYGVLFLFSGDWSAIIDFTIAAAVLGSVLKLYVKIPKTLWVVSMAVFAGASLIGFFVHFRDSGESGPLPFEWLNQYYHGGIPALFLIGLSVALSNRDRTRAEQAEDTKTDHVPS